MAKTFTGLNDALVLLDGTDILEGGNYTERERRMLNALFAIRKLTSDPAVSAILSEVLETCREAKPLTYSLLLSNLSGQGQSADPIRGIIVGLQLRSGNVVSLEDADVSMIKAKLSQVGYGDLVKGQLQEFLERGHPVKLTELLK